MKKWIRRNNLLCYKVGRLDDFAPAVGYIILFGDVTLFLVHILMLIFYALFICALD